MFSLKEGLVMAQRVFCRKVDAHREVAIVKVMADQPTPDRDRFMWPGTVYAEVNKTV